MALDVGGIVARLSARLDDDGFDRFDRRFDQAEAKAKRGIHAKADVDSDRAERGLRKYDQAVEKTTRSHGFLRTSTGGVTAGISTIGKSAAFAAGPFALYGLFKVTQSAFGAFKESQRVARQTNAVLKSTGQVAGVTAKDVNDLANSISRKTGIDDEAIQSGENLLLTFTNVRDEAGKGNKVFSRATGLLADMSAALGQDTKSSAIQLGKALNDPIKGVTALQRVGVSFTKQQRDQIETLVKSGHTLDAQKIILRELGKEFGGSAEATATSSAKLKTSLGNLAEAGGRLVSPMFERIARRLDKFVDGMVKGRGAGGKFVDILKRIGDRTRDALGGVGRIAGKAKDAIGDLLDNVGKARKGGAGIASSIGGAIGKAISGIDFKGLGDKLGDGLEAALDFSGKVGGAVQDGISAALSNIDTKKVGAQFAGVLVEALGTLTDPGFWIHHLGALFSAVTFVIPIGKIFKIPGFAALYRYISAPFFRAVGSVATGLVRLFGRMGERALSAVLDELEKLAPRTIGTLRRWITGAGKEAGTLAVRLAMYASRAVDAVEEALVDGAGKIAGAVTRWVGRGVKALAGAVVDWAKGGARLASRVLGAIDKGLGGVPSAIVRWLRRGVGRIGGLAGDAASAAAGFGKGIVTGIVNAIKSAAGAVREAIVGLIPGPLRKVAAKIPGIGGLFKRRGGRVGPTVGGPRLFIAGEGAADEWVISQEGNRGENVRWAREALESLTGRRVELHRGGKGAKGKPHHKRKPLKPILTGGQVGSAVVGQERGLANFDRDLSRLERVYGQLDREAGLSQEDFIVEHDDGTTTLDEDAIGKRVIELDTQITFLRNQIGDKLRAYRKAVQAALAVYKTVIDRLTRAIGRAKGARRANERAGYVAKRDAYVGRRAELADKFDSLGLDLEDNRLDIEELTGEKSDVLGTKLPPPPKEDDTAGTGGTSSDTDTADTGGTSSDTGGGGAAPAPEATPPTPLEIAAAAAEQLRSFTEGRAALFGSSGANFAAAGVNPFGDETGQAAGVRAFGATGAADLAGPAGARSPMARGGVTIVQHFAAPPPDPHVWAHEARYTVEGMA
jgi:hypothetical protein